jgi:hypothetical protein
MKMCILLGVARTSNGLELRRDASSRLTIRDEMLGRYHSRRGSSVWHYYCRTPFLAPTPSNSDASPASSASSLCSSWPSSPFPFPPPLPLPRASSELLFGASYRLVLSSSLHCPWFLTCREMASAIWPDWKQEHVSPATEARYLAGKHSAKAFGYSGSWGLRRTHAVLRALDMTSSPATATSANSFLLLSPSSLHSSPAGMK